MTRLAPALRFEGFVVGAGNRLAATAARAVAEAPGAVYNPLFIYGPPGLGKTHLLTAITHAAKQVNRDAGVEYLTADQAIDAFQGAIATGKIEAYRRRFAGLDMLLLDDVQILAGQREMQGEVLRMIDLMQRAGRQIVLASDRPPAEIDALDERLARRFGGGLIVDIAAPDYETRVAILRRRAEQREVRFADGVLEALAQPDVQSVRELIGALNRLVALQAARSGPVSPADAHEIVGELRRTITPEPPPPVADGDLTGVVDEFADFLEEVSATVAEQVEVWRTRVAEAILRWEGEGFRVARLESLLDDGRPERDPAQQLAAFADDVEELMSIRSDLAAIAPDLAGDPILSDPDQLDAARALLARAEAGVEPPPGPSSHWRLDDFIEAAGNRLAIRGVRSAVADPGERYNPLVIVAGSGNGKTHLLHAMGNALQARGLVVACLNAHEFTEDLIAAIEQEQVARWRVRWRRVEALLLDDIQLLGDKQRTQEELFLLFNELATRGVPMAFASAVAPPALEGLEKRLRTRLEGGLVVTLPAPDRGLRERLAERWLAARVASVEAALPAYLAAQPAESVRATAGLVERVLQAAEAEGVPPSVALARGLLEGEPPRTRKPQARSSGVLPLAASGIQSREKMVWEWPDLSGRIVEDWR